VPPPVLAPPLSRTWGGTGRFRRVAELAIFSSPGQRPRHGAGSRFRRTWICFFLFIIVAAFGGPKSANAAAGFAVGSARLSCIQKGLVARARGHSMARCSSSGQDGSRNGTAAGDSDQATIFSDLQDDFASGKIWDRPIASNEDGVFIVGGIFALVGLVVSAREVFEFFAAQEEGSLALDRFFGRLQLKALVVFAFFGLVAIFVNAVGPKSTGKDGTKTDDPLKDFFTSDYWNEPIAFDLQSIALAVVGVGVALFTTSTSLHRWSQEVNDSAVQRLPELSLGSPSLPLGPL